MVVETHILQASEKISSPAAAVFAVLTDVMRAYKHFASSTAHIEVLTPTHAFGKGFKWRETRRVLYLREDCIFTVTDYDDRALRYGLQMDDGFNCVKYSFIVEPCGPACAVVRCEVDCRTRPEGHSADGCQPSERLARMMAKQDGLLVQRLKSHIESSYPVQCC